MRDSGSPGTEGPEADPPAGQHATTPPPLPASRRERLIGYASAFLVVVIWAGFSLMSRHAARGTGVRLTPWDLGLLRFGIAGVIAAGMWTAGLGRGLPWRRSLPVAALAGAGFALPSYLGFTFAPAAHGALMLSGTLPFLVAIGTRFAFHERWSRTRIASLGILLAGIGLFAIEAYGWDQAPPRAWIGDALFLSAAISWAAYTVLVRSWAPSPTQTIVAVGLWCGAFFVPLWLTVLPGHLTQAPWREILMQAVFQGVIAVTVSLWLYIRAIASLGAGRVTTITALVPGTAAVLAVPLLNEPLGILSVMGLVLVCAAVALGMGRPGR